MRLGLDDSQGRDIESEVDAHYRTLRLIWMAVLASVIGIFVVTRLVPTEATAANAVFWILLVVGLGNLAASFVLKQKLLKEARQQHKPERIRSAYVLAFALCESVGLLGVIVHFITGVEYYYFLFVLSGFGILVHKPQRDELLVALGGGEL